MMSRLPSSYRSPLIFAVTLHILLIIGLFIHLSPSTYTFPQTSPNNAQIVHATTVSSAQVQQEVHAIQQAERQQQAQKIAHMQRLQAQALAAKRERALEQQRLVALQHKIQQAKLEQQRLAQAKAAQAKAIAKAKAQAKAQEAKALLMRQKAALLQKKLAQETMRKEQQTLQQQLLQQQLTNEQGHIQQVQSKDMSGIIDEYKAKILNAIGQNWLIPNGVNDNMQALFLIKLAPGGTVLNVQLLQSSGDTTLDQSAKVAIYKSSPLPVPQDPTVFDQFRELRLTVSPKDVLTG